MACMFCVVINYAAREYWNAQFEVDFSAGDIGYKEYAGERAAVVISNVIDIGKHGAW